MTNVLKTKVDKTIKYQIENSLGRELNIDHIGIFREVYRPKIRMHEKQEGNTYDFYFTSQKGSKPPSYDDPWYNHIVDFVELTKFIVNMKKLLMIKPTRK